MAGAGKVERGELLMRSLCVVPSRLLAGASHSRADGAELTWDEAPGKLFDDSLFDARKGEEGPGAWGDAPNLHWLGLRMSKRNSTKERSKLEGDSFVYHLS